MQRTLEKYRQAIQTDRINPIIHWDGRRSGLIFDPADPKVPLEVLAFGGYRLEQGPFTMESGDREVVLVPVTAKFEVKVGSSVFAGDRSAGPFAELPGPSSSCAIYIPRGAKFTMSGTGEMILFSAPARGDKPPAYVRPHSCKNLRRGSGVWHRDVITTFTPEDVTTNLVGGETYSPPGLWSGTPLHVHDKDDVSRGQSDHEEVYYHLARATGGDWGPYGVQMLFDNHGLDKCYMVHNRSAMAIPGAAHPVVVGPASDMLYIWALAGESDKLAMLDIAEFAYLKKVGAAIDELDAKRSTQTISPKDFDALCRKHDLAGEQALICKLHLEERGFRVG
jgi:5-deoxy-D-glucuronate isomerase